MKNIVLTGFMGTGKNAIGKRLAQELNLKFVDTDTIIEKKEETTISEIFEKRGEEYFRRVEKEVVKEITQEENQVISTGGGVVLDEENVAHLRKNGFIICLWASPEVIEERTREETHRPLLEGEDRKKKIKELLVYRKSFYHKNADYMVDTSRLSVEEAVARIREQIKREKI